MRTTEESSTEAKRLKCKGESGETNQVRPISGTMNSCGGRLKKTGSIAGDQKNEAQTEKNQHEA